MRIVGLVLAGLLALPAAAAEIALPGRAVMGDVERPATLRLSCDPAGRGLGAALTIPLFAEFSGFDFAGLEGQAADARPLSSILVSSGSGVRSVLSPATGGPAADAATSFVLTVAGASRGQDPLRSIVPAMAEAGARIVWTQFSPRKGDANLVATFPVAEPAAIRTALQPCVPG